MKTLSILLLTLMIGLSSCAPDQGTSTGNPLVNLRLSPYTAFFSVVAQNAGRELVLQGVTSLRLCFKRLRFKRAGETTDSNPASDGDNLDFALGEVTVTGQGVNLGSVNLPAGTYRRVEFDLESDCSSGHSVELSNNNGTFVTSQRVTIKFEGTFSHSLPDHLSLNLQTIIDALAGATSGADIRTRAEGATGAFD